MLKGSRNFLTMFYDLECYFLFGACHLFCFLNSTLNIMYLAWCSVAVWRRLNIISCTGYSKVLPHVIWPHPIQFIIHVALLFSKGLTTYKFILLLSYWQCGMWEYVCPIIEIIIFVIINAFMSQLNAVALSWLEILLYYVFLNCWFWGRQQFLMT